jgi:hypothetical protein
MEEENIAGLPGDTGGLARLLEFVDGDGAGTGRFESSARATQGRLDIEEHRPAGNAALRPALDGIARPGLDVVGGGAVVELVGVVGDMTQRVPLARRLGKVVVQFVVEGGVPAYRNHGVLEGTAPEHRRVDGIERSIETEDLARPDEAGRGSDPFGGLEREQPDRIG